MTPCVVLAVLWIIWCFLHSLLISRPVAGFIKNRFAGANRFYRIGYNITAGVTLIPVILYGYSIHGPLLFRWDGQLRFLQALLLISALLLFIAGARRYDLKQFSGISRIRRENACETLTADCSLDTGGVLGMLRHPWYTGGIILVWARDMDVSAILTNLVISAYFVVGAILEERRLVTTFGREYRDYQRRVSMWLPVKWMRRKWLDRQFRR